MDTSVVVGVAGQVVAFPASAVTDMVRLPTITAVPGIGAAWRGVVNLRGRVIPAVDLRIRLGLPPFQTMAEALAELPERRREHIRWVEELADCARTGREFTLATDPRECNFGRWYYAFQTSSLSLQAIMGRIEGPHSNLHAAAAVVLTEAAAGHADQVESLIEQLHTRELATLGRLFDEALDLAAEGDRQVAVVVHATHTVALVVDQVLAVETLEPIADGTMLDDAGVAADGLVTEVARRPRSEELVLMLDPDALTTSPAMQMAA